MKQDISGFTGDAHLNFDLSDSDYELSDTSFMGIELPYVIKDKILLSPGTWNKFFYTKDVINRAHKNTDWSDKKVRNLYLDHEDNRTSEWAGYIVNPRCVNGTEYGDIHIYDPITAVKMAKGKPKFGISPRVKGQAEDGIMKRFLYENFSFVINPACKTTYINNMEVKNMDFKLQSEDETKVETPELEEEAQEEKKEELAKKKPEKKEKEKEKEMKKKKPEEEENYPEEELSAWTDKVKSWLKKHPGKSVSDAVKALKKNQEEQELAQEDERFGELLSELSEMLKKKKPEEEKMKKKEEYPYKEKMEELESKIAKLEQENKELKEKPEETEEKLSEPGERVTTKSEGEVTQMLEYSDENFLRYVREEVQGGSAVM